MGKISYGSEVIDCVCGNKISFYEQVDDLRSELQFSGYTDSAEDTGEHECSQCHRKYELQIEASVTFSVDHTLLTELETPNEYFDKDNQRLSPLYFESLMAGSVTNLWDGEYIHNNMSYRIDNGEVTYILSAETDENQMDIFEFEEVHV